MFEEILSFPAITLKQGHGERNFSHVIGKLVAERKPHTTVSAHIYKLHNPHSHTPLSSQLCASPMTHGLHYRYFTAKSRVRKSQFFIHRQIVYNNTPAGLLRRACLLSNARATKLPHRASPAPPTVQAVPMPEAHDRSTSTYSTRTLRICRLTEKSGRRSPEEKSGFR